MAYLSDSKNGNQLKNKLGSRTAVIIKFISFMEILVFPEWKKNNGNEFLKITSISILKAKIKIGIINVWNFHLPIYLASISFLS